jgi:uncharacterized protein YjbJ (UPF0337 family)
MGLLDKVRGLGKKADDAADVARDHADKLPGDMGEKVTDIADKVDEATDKIPGADQ